MQQSCVLLDISNHPGKPLAFACCCTQYNKCKPRNKHQHGCEQAVVGTGWESRPVSPVFPGDAHFSEVTAEKTKLCTCYSVWGTGELCLVSAESCRWAYRKLCSTGCMRKCRYFYARVRGTGPGSVWSTASFSMRVNCLMPPSLLSVLIYNLYHKSFYHSCNSESLCFFLIIAITILGMDPDPGNAQSFPH